MSNTIEKLLAIVVVYNKNILESETLISLGRDLLTEGYKLDLYLYDNSPVKQPNCTIDGFNILNHYHDGNNVGVSSAYNKGVNYAEEINKSWVLLLDQDTSFSIGVIKKYVKNIENNKDIKLFSPIIKLEDGSFFSPFKKFFMRGFVMNDIQATRYSLKRFSPVNSGMLIDVKSFLSVNGYNEKVKLDFSDMEFIRRLSRVEKEFVVIDSLCYQDFSNTCNDVLKLNTRFAFFCEGAKNCEKNNIVERMQFFIVVFLRMLVLIKRTRNTIFFKTFLNSY